MIFWIIFFAIWILGIPFAYEKMRAWEGHSKFEISAFSVIWPLVGILYGIHWAHMKLG